MGVSVWACLSASEKVGKYESMRKIFRRKGKSRRVRKYVKNMFLREREDADKNENNRGNYERRSQKNGNSTDNRRERRVERTSHKKKKKEKNKYAVSFVKKKNI